VSNPLIVHTSDKSFETDVLKSPEPVLLDFWAEWWTCKMIGPISDAARDYRTAQGRENQISTSPATPHEIQRARHPTLMLFKNGKVRRRSVRCPDPS
jgi:thioredoxin 1